MESGRLEMAYSILLPCLFSVYLHPDDYARLAGVQDLIKEDAKRALSARMAEWNANKSGKSLLRRGAPRKEFRIAQNDWWIEFFPDTEGSVPPGDVEIHSELNDVAQPGYRGAKTTLIEREPSVPAETVVRDRQQHAPQRGQGFRRNPLQRRFRSANFFRDAERNQHRARRRRSLGRSAALFQRRGFARAR